MKLDRAAFRDLMVQRFGRERWNEHVKLLANSAQMILRYFVSKE